MRFFENRGASRKLSERAKRAQGFERGFPNRFVCLSVYVMYLCMYVSVYVSVCLWTARVGPFLDRFEQTFF